SSIPRCSTGSSSCARASRSSGFVGCSTMPACSPASRRVRRSRALRRWPSAWTRARSSRSCPTPGGRTSRRVHGPTTSTSSRSARRASTTGDGHAVSEPPTVADAVAVLRRGGLVAFPTETVYGLGCDAENVEALERLYTVKGRPADHPVIVHLAGASQLASWGRDVSSAAYALADECWPGPLTLVVPRGERVPDAVTGGRDTVALRVPDQPLALELLAAFGGGIAAPSANRFGRVSPTSAADVRDDLGDDVDLVLD